MPNRLKLARSLEEGLTAALVGVGSEVAFPGTGWLAFGLALYVVLLIERVRGA